MDSNVTDTTQLDGTSASVSDEGVKNQASLNEDDLASYLMGQQDHVIKGNQGGRSIPNPFDDTPVSESEVEDHADGEDELDLGLLDSDSEQDTNADEAESKEEEPSYELQVDGQKIKVKQSDLIADAQKWRASNDKFQEASKMRKEADELMSAYQQERETLKGLINHYQNFIDQSYKSQEPDWQTLFDANPAEYIRQKEIWAARMNQVQLAMQHQEQIKAQEVAELKAREVEFVAQQRAKLLDVFPTWKDDAVRAKAGREIMSYLNAEGFSQSEADGLTDVRYLVVAHKAAMYDKLVKANAEKKAKAEPSKQTLKAGVGTNRDPGFAKRQAQTQAARDAKAVNDQFRSNPSQRTLEAYLASQWTTKKR
ncbi:hypothetical protein [Burkholderia guangdongensis]|uniref:hypothetical protein n=1 Tax=Burkholderia guangdongensis TaxID=1792500 RepID=UPI0015CE1CE3|nr:hypothetical protein [Burkholderia guangdongensis]